ncbi:MAG TPA: outer membrane beta-barrel protein [Gemmatimonadaceae bacterium]|nr:outer membrane beta-barrel protein [Gemmatimonadaceae bacterium]
MRTTHVLLAAAFVAATAAVPARAHAQGIPHFSIEGAGVYVNPEGTDFEGIDGSFGFEAQARLSLGMLSLGAGYQRSVHEVQGFSNDMRVNGFFAEPRLNIPLPGPFKPYILGRVTRTSENMDVDDPIIGTGDLETHGWAFGAGAGFMLHLAPMVAINLSAEYNHLSLDDFQLDGSTMDDTNSSGQNLALRAGLSIGLGH